MLEMIRHAVQSPTTSDDDEPAKQIALARDSVDAPTTDPIAPASPPATLASPPTTPPVISNAPPSAPSTPPQLPDPPPPELSAPIAAENFLTVIIPPSADTFIAESLDDFVADEDRSLLHLVEDPKPPNEDSMVLARSTFDRVAVMGYEWAKNKGMPLMIPGTATKIVWTQTYKLDTPGEFVITARVRCCHPGHDESSCNKSRTLNKKFTDPHGPIQLVGYLGAWLVKADQFRSTARHMDPSKNPTSEETERFLIEHKLISVAAF